MGFNYKSLLNDALDYFFPGDCFDQFFKMNFSHKNCMPILLSRILGVGITMGSSFLLVPQILKIYGAKNGEGISLIAQLLGLLSAAGTAAYSYERKFIFGQWGDSLFVALQTMLIIMQILYYSNSKANAIVFGSFCWMMVLAIAYHHVPLRILGTIQAATLPITFLSKSIQIWTNFRQGTTGQLSVISVFMQFAGCAARVFTSVQETNGDWLIIAPFLVATLLNGIVFAQIIFYSRFNNATERDEKKKK